MNFQFNLVEAPWIPCVRLDGRPVTLGLRDTLSEAHTLRELGGESPLVTAALHRLLLAILHRVYDGPDSLEAWEALWVAKRWDAAPLAAYFERWRERFELFHPQRPFYQAADPRVKPKSITAMLHEIASGNNATLFDHHTDAEGIGLTPAQAARALVAAQAFGLAGLSGLPQKFTDGSCARGVLLLVQGETLFETLALNLLRYNDHGKPPVTRGPEDLPAWEMADPFTPERMAPQGYLDYLTWQNRRILFLPEGDGGEPVVRQMTMGPGLRLDAAITDPMKHYRRSDKYGLLVLRFTEERALWRDSATLFRLRDTAAEPSRVFLWLSSLVEAGVLPIHQTRRTLALGMANNQAKVEFFRSEPLPLPLAYLQDEALVDRLGDALKMAEEVGGQLWGATRTLAQLVVAPESDSEEGHKPRDEDLAQVMGPWNIERRYWSRLETPFRATLEALAVAEQRDGALERWQQTLRRTAREALEDLLSDLEYDPRRLKATVRARGQLLVGLAKVFPEPQGSGR